MSKWYCSITVGGKSVVSAILPPFKVTSCLDTQQIASIAMFFVRKYEMSASGIALVARLHAGAYLCSWNPEEPPRRADGRKCRQHSTTNRPRRPYSRPCSPGAQIRRLCACRHQKRRKRGRFHKTFHTQPPSALRTYRVRVALSSRRWPILASPGTIVIPAPPQLVDINQKCASCALLANQAVAGLP